MKQFATLLFILWSVLVSKGWAQQWTLLKDINPTGDSYVEFITEWTGSSTQKLLIADNGVHGYELWITDGTVDGTKMLKDINPTGDAFVGTEMAMLGNNLYFFADDGVHGAELWKTDGTAVGTVLVKDIFPTTVQYQPDQTNILTIGNAIYFLANDGVNGREIWKSDGTALGTMMLANLNTTGDFANNNDLYHLEVFNDDILVHGTIAAQTGLWKISTSGNAQFLFAYQYSGSQNNFTFNGKFYFRSFNNGYKLYATDGTNVGTTLVHSGNCVSNAVVYNNDCYFIGDNNDNQTTTNLWKISKSDNSIVLVKKISNKQTQSTDLIVLNNKMLFYANDDVNDYVWMKSDGTAGGTTQLQDFTTSTHNASDLYAYNYVFNNELYLVAEYGTSDYALFKTNGTTVNFVQNFIVSDDLGDLWSFGVINNKLYVSAANAETGLELYTPEQTATGIFSSQNTTLNVNMYPNPFTDGLHIDIKETRSFTYQIVDIKGVPVRSGSFVEDSINTIDTHKLHAGMYVVMIYENGSLKGSYKVIK